MDNETRVYRYLDEDIRKLREESLRAYLGKSDSDLIFTDLNIYDFSNTFQSNLKREFYRSALDKSIILTKYQIEILNILENNSLFLSAPTSFGKTFTILEYLFRKKDVINNVIFIIPTIALMNELLKKINDIFGDTFNICINSNEPKQQKNIFLLVPERSDSNFVKSLQDLKIDLLVFDEIYKLQPSNNKERKNDDRIINMNKVYLDLLKSSKKIVLLGPYISNVSFGNTKLDIIKYYTNYMPVYNEKKMLNEGEDWTDCLNEKNQLIYFKSPRNIYQQLNKIIEKLPENENYIEEYKDEIEYLSDKYGDEWYVISLLKRGIGIHHGKTPMFLRKFYETEYNSSKIKKLICTNTLMEGINTPTKSLIIVDDPGSPFKLNNLIGRVGRLNPSSPEIGEVIICDSTTFDNLNNISSWLDLNILAETDEVITDDEVLYFEKNYSDEAKQHKYESYINEIEEKLGTNRETLREKGIEIKRLRKITEDDKYKDFEKCDSIYACIVLSLEIINAPHYYFETELFNNLDRSIKYLPYKIYLEKILLGFTFKDILNDFNAKFNSTHDIRNINMFIDNLFELKNFIKFKLVKIINYIELFNLDVKTNEHLRKYIFLLSSFNDMPINNKILDDLGIETDDANKILKKLNLNDDFSASNLISVIKTRKSEVLKEDLSPFSKKNISNL